MHIKFQKTVFYCGIGSVVFVFGVIYIFVTYQNIRTHQILENSILIKNHNWSIFKTNNITKQTIKPVNMRNKNNPFNTTTQVELTQRHNNLTVLSFWRDNFDHLFVAHIRFYFAFWRAFRLFLMIDITAKTDMLFISKTIFDLCKNKSVSESVLNIFIHKCENGSEIWLLYTQADNILKYASSSDSWHTKKQNLLSIYQKSKNKTRNHLLVDHDEFFVPKNFDVASALKRKKIYYHLIDIKPVKGIRNFADDFQWVDQSYFYKLRCNHFNYKYPDYQYDGMLDLVNIFNRKSHINPWKKFQALHNCSKQVHLHIRLVFLTMIFVGMYQYIQKIITFTIKFGIKQNQDPQHILSIFLTKRKIFTNVFCIQSVISLFSMIHLFNPFLTLEWKN